jgi:predicted CoA-binding protein
VKFQNPSPAEIHGFLKRIQTIAVVGLSADPDRPSYSVAMYLQNNGYRIVPVRPDIDVILGEKVYRRLHEVPYRIDVVDCFRKANAVGYHVDEAITLRIPAVWLQEGVIDDAAAERARRAGLFVVMDHCLLKEHRKAGLSNSKPPSR